MRPYTERVAGNDVTWVWTEATRSLHVSYYPVVGSNAPSEIVVPERTWPEGYDVDCGGCRYETPAGRLRVLGYTGGITLKPHQ